MLRLLAARQRGCTIDALDGAVIGGRFPPNISRVVKRWTTLRRDALMRNWRAGRTDGSLERIGHDRDPIALHDEMQEAGELRQVHPANDMAEYGAMAQRIAP
jgi:hypothetical protein